MIEERKWLESLGVVETEEGIFLLENEDDELLRSLLTFELGEVKMEWRSRSEIRRLLFSSDLSILEKGNFSEKDFSWESEPIKELLDTLLFEALSLKASDIHLEGDEICLRVRFRREGILDLHRELPLWLKDSLIQRIKILSGMDIAEKRLPQDGSFSRNDFGIPLDIRSSTLPTKFGEKCVLRLLPQDSCATLEALHFSDELKAFLTKILHRPQGLFIVCGPTGSGKSTTMYALIKEILKRPLNVSTIEDPVERILPGINQAEVNERAGFTFARALRALMRQDPDVIFVGEIRDEETAKISLQASRTGHLVLATLHANASHAVKDRLKDLGLSPFDLEDSLIGVLSQRLLRSTVGGRIPIVEWIDFISGEHSESIAFDAEEKRLLGLVTKEEIERVLGR